MARQRRQFRKGSKRRKAPVSAPAPANLGPPLEAVQRAQGLICRLMGACMMTGPPPIQNGKRVTRFEVPVGNEEWNILRQAGFESEPDPEKPDGYKIRLVEYMVTLVKPKPDQKPAAPVKG